MKNETYVDKTTLLRIYNEFKSNPQKVFVAKDLFKSSTQKLATRYFGLLISLGIIEKVKAVYYTGFKNKVIRNLNGYRLLQK